MSTPPPPRHIAATKGLLEKVCDTDTLAEWLTNARRRFPQISFVPGFKRSRKDAHACTLTAEKNSGNERDRDRWKEGCAWGERCASSDTCCEITMTVLFFLLGATGPIHFLQWKVTDWRPNISFFPRLPCLSPFLPFFLSLSCAFG